MTPAQLAARSANSHTGRAARAAQAKARATQAAELYRQGWDVPAIAARLGTTTRTTRRDLRNTGARPPQAPTRLTTEQLARIEALLNDGWSYAEIGRTLGHHPGTLRRHFPGRAMDHKTRTQLSGAARRANTAMRNRYAVRMAN